MIREWQTWHSYSSYFNDSLPDLDSVAANLVRFGIAETALTSEGLCYWSVDRSRVAGYPKELLSGRVTVEPEAADYRRAAISFPKGIDGYAREAAYEYGAMRYSELKLFGDRDLPPRYVRAFLGLCVIGNDKARHYLYPQIKIFETGVVVVQFRVFSAGSTAVAAFVNEVSNAPLSNFDKLWIPPAIAAWIPTAFPEDGIFKWYRRPLTAYRRADHHRGVSEHVQTESTGDFAFQVVSDSLAHELAAASAIAEHVTPVVRRELEQMAERTISDYERHLKAGNPPDRAMEEELLERLKVDSRRVMRSTSRRLVSAAMKALRSIKTSPKTYAELALTIMGVAGLVAGSRKKGPRRGLGFLVMGPGSINVAGSHWVGRPHVHLIRFADQAELASRNEELFGGEFGSILARVVTGNREDGRRHLPKSARLYEDHAAYITKGSTLWVHARSGIDAEAEWQDANRGELVYEHQIKAELLDYGYSLHRRITDRAMQGEFSMTDVVAAQRDLIQFEWAVQNSTRFGEVHDLLRAGWEAYEVPRLRESASQALQLLHDQAAYAREVVANRGAAFLAVVFGLLTAPSIATGVLKPLWAWRQLPLPQSADAAELLLSGAALALVAIVVGVGYVVFVSRGRT